MDVELLSSVLLIEELSKKAKERYDSLTQEEKIEYDRIKDLRLKRSEYNKLLSSGTCPNCKSKLKRNGKNKNRDYKREWECKKCNNKFYQI